MKSNGAAIKAIRERTGLSQTDAAALTGGAVSRPLWANIEAGRRNGLPATLKAIATALNVPLTAIVASYPVELPVSEPAA